MAGKLPIFTTVGQVQEVTKGQKRDQIVVGKGEQKSRLTFDAGEIKGLVAGDKVRITVESDPKLDLGMEE